MDKLGTIWSWLSNADNQRTLGFIGSGVAAAVAAAWALYRHFSKSPSKATPAITGVQIVGGSVSGPVTVTQNIQNIQNIQTTPEQFDALLQKRLKEVVDQLPQADPAKRARLDKEKVAIEAKYDNLQKAFEEQKAKLAEAYQALGQFKQEVPAGQIEAAQKALAQGETGSAEKLFQQVLEKSQAEAEKRNKEAAEAAYQLGVLAESRINYQMALKYYHKALLLQPDNPLYLNIAGNLNRTLGQYQESEKLLKRALELREKALNPEHLDLASSLNDLGELYWNKGKYEEAEPLYRRALSIRENALNQEHPDVAMSLNNLAALYFCQRKYEEAEPLFKRALAIYENIHESKRPNIATLLNSLAELYRVQGKYEEAEHLYRQALAIDEKSLRPEHPDIAIRFNNLAALYYAQGKYGDAESLYLRALSIWEKAFGPEHPNVSTCLKNYAALLKKMGREAEAAPLEARAQAILEKQAKQNFQR
jgi:tetratricopeptide (TPR) repeat protein